MMGPRVSERDPADPTPGAQLDAELLAAELLPVEHRLMEAYGNAVGPDEVARCLASAVAAFDGVKVRTYVVLLIERRAARDLRAAAEARLAIGGLQT